MKNQVQLITYIDRFGQTLQGLRKVLRNDFSGAFAGVHLLPFFHSIHGVDAGFDPIDHLSVDATLGTWGDIAELAKDVDVMADVIVNHMSSASPQFLDYKAKGAASPYASLFLSQDRVFPHGASTADLAGIYRPRPTPAFTLMRLDTGEEKLLWTTFTAEQIDIDIRSAAGQAYLQSILQTLAANGVSMARLDAVGYAVKKAGTSCFMLPETFEFIAQFAAQAKALGIEVLVEVHSYYQTQIDIARQVDWVYDFALPPLVLHAFCFGTAKPLKNWIAIRPSNAVTVLDTHDGIGIIDIGSDKSDRMAKPGLVPDAELDALVESIHNLSQGQSRLATGAAASNLDLYQVNCTYYEALGQHDAAYLLARAVQFFMPGIPQVYYVGLLAGMNDMDLLARTQVGRDINRHYYTDAEIQTELQRPVVQSLLDLIRLRNAHPAFGGRFELLGNDAGANSVSTLGMRWLQQDGAASHHATLWVDFAAKTGELRYSDAANANDELQLAFA